MGGLPWMALAVGFGVTGRPSHSITGIVRVTVVKAVLDLAPAAARGVLTYRHRNYYSL